MPVANVRSPSNIPSPTVEPPRGLHRWGWAARRPPRRSGRWRRSGEGGAEGVDGLEVLEGELRPSPERRAEPYPVAMRVRGHEREESRDDRVPRLHAVDGPRLVHTELRTPARRERVDVDTQQLALRPAPFIGV